jgi:tripartite-type tricarboxylate transporter receptor subunit TctC
MAKEVDMHHKPGFTRFARTMCCLVAAGIALTWNAGIQAADYPAKAVRLIIGQPAGGPTDIAARIFADKLREQLGQPVIVENKPGAATQISIMDLVKAEPDGYTLIYGGLGLSVLPYMSKSYNVDSLRDTTLISLIVDLPAGIAVSTAGMGNVHNLDEFMADIRAHPGKRFYGNMGATDYLLMQVLRQEADLPFETVRFNGASPAFQSMFAGDVQFTYTTIGILKPLVDQGKVRIIVIAGNKRSPLAPGVPTISESRDPKLRALADNGFSPGWQGLVGPARVPQNVVDRLYDASVKVTRDPEFVKRMGDFGLDPVGSTPAEFYQRVKQDMASWQRITKLLNYQPE